MKKFFFKLVAALGIMAISLGTSLVIPLVASAKDGSDDSSSSSGSSGSSGSGGSDSSSSSSAEQLKATDSSKPDSSDTSASSSSKGDKHGSDSKSADVNKSDTQQEIEKTQNNEDEVGQELDHDQKTIDSIEVPELRSTDVRTFDDATNKIDGLDHALTTVQDNLNLSQVTTGLDTAQKALLHALAVKHQGDSDAVQARIDALKSQITDLHDLLVPLAGQSITDPQLRALLIKTIKDFRDQVRDVTDMAKLNVKLVDTETK